MNQKDLKTLIRQIIKEAINIVEKLQGGEWWIYPGGDVQFADINIGDSGHEGYVIQHLSGEILSHFGLEIDEPGLLAQHEEELKQALINDGKLSPEEQEEWEMKSPSEIILRKVIETGLYKDAKQAEDAVYIAYGSSSRDGRDYAMKYLGWKRLDIRSSGAYVQTWFLTPEDLGDIACGVSDAGEDYGEEPGEEDTQTVEIEVRSNNKRYINIPLDVLHQPDAMNALGDYKAKTSWINESIFHENKDWIMYEGDGKVTTLFKDKSRLALEVRYHDKRGIDKDKYKSKAASRWKSIAREIYNGTGLSEGGNPIIKPWKVCFQEALDDPRMKEFIKKDFNPIF
jgi:hypothetical protein